VLVYGNLAIRQRLGIPPTLSHGGTRAWAEYPELGRWTMGFRGTMMMSLRAARWWIIGPAILVNAYEYSPWGPKGDIGYGTEFLAAVTVDIAMGTASTLAGALVYAGILALGFPPSWALVGSALAFLGTLWLGPKLREPLIEAVNEVYKDLAGGLNRGQGGVFTR
jgi:hypothetical protein